MPFNPVAADEAVAFGRNGTLPFQIDGQAFHLVGSLLHGRIVVGDGECGHQAVESRNGFAQLLLQTDGIVLGQSGQIDVGAARIAIVVASHGVHAVAHRVDALFDLQHVFRLRHVGQQLLVHHAEIAVEVDDELLIVESFAVIGYAGLQTADVLCLQVFELLTVPEVELEVHLVGRNLHASGVGQHDLCPIEALVGFVDDNLIKHSGFGIFLLHIQVDVGHTAIEHAFGNFNRR